MQGQQTAGESDRYTYKNKIRRVALVADKGGDKRERKGGTVGVTDRMISYKK